MSSTQAPSSSSDVATYKKTQLEFEEKNSNRSRRTIYWRERPIHALAKLPVLWLLFTKSTLTHWGVQIGKDYIWELEVQDGKVGYHVGAWLVPEKQGATFIGTEHDGDPNIAESFQGQMIGQTCMTDFEIKAKGSAWNNRSWYKTA